MKASAGSSPCGTAVPPRINCCLSGDGSAAAADAQSASSSPATPSDSSPFLIGRAYGLETR
jgi:hypothetical protein